MARWWYGVDMPSNAFCPPYYQLMLDVIVSVGKGFKGPTMHNLRGSLIYKEVGSINDYLKSFKESWTKTLPSSQMDGVMESFIP